MLSVSEGEQIEQQQQITSISSSQKLIHCKVKKKLISQEAQSRISQSELSAKRALEQIGSIR